MIYITGRTYDHKFLLIRLGAEWNDRKSRWELAGISETNMARLRQCVGLVIVESEEPRRPDKPGIYGDDDRFFNQFADKNPTAFFGFSSLPKFVDYVEGLTPQPRMATHDRHAAWSKSPERVKFCATADMAEAIRIARDGWTDGMNLTEQFRLPPAIGRKRAYSAAGGSVSVGRMLAGNPSHMRVRRPAPGRAVWTLFVGIGSPFHIKAIMMILRVFLIAGIIDRMESEGYRCEVIAVDSSLETYTFTTGQQYAITVKQAHERLSLLDLTFALGHPSMLRRLCFAACASAPECSTSWESQGSPTPVFDASHPVGENQAYFPGLTRQDQAWETNPMLMLPHIAPDNLPINLKDMER